MNVLQNHYRSRKRTVTLLCLALFCLLFLPTPIVHAASLAQAPVPEVDDVTTEEDTPILIDVLANDSETNGNPLILAEVGEPRNGTAEIVGNQIRYTPKANFLGRDSFFYTVHNGDVAKTRQTDVNVTITGVNDAPTEILLRRALFGTEVPNPLSEKAEVNSIVGVLQARDPDLICNFFFVSPDCHTRFESGYLFTLTGTDNDNQFFALEQPESGSVNLLVGQSLVGRGKASYKIGVQVRDPEGATFTQDLFVQGLNAGAPPTAILLDKSNIDENLPLLSRVGIFTSVDPDTPSVNDHTYTLVDGSGSDDNAAFSIIGRELRSAAVFDFETKPVLTIRVRSTDNTNSSLEQILLIAVNNIFEPTATPSPTPSPTFTPIQPTHTPTPGPTATFTPSPTPLIFNTLSFCSGNSITLFEFQSNIASKRVLVRIDNVVISNLGRTSCTVNGKLTIITNGNTRTGLTFSGDVNARNQFDSSSIPDFEFSIAGIQLVAKGVGIEYISERPTLHITRPELKMPRDFGGLSAQISVPTSIDTGGVKFGTGKINLPSIRTASGFALELSGSLRSVANGFEIQADGDLTIPNIKKGKAANGRECTIGAGVTIFVDGVGRTVMAIQAGDALATSPDGVDAVRLSAVRARASCDPGLPIGSSGLFLTSVSGEVTLTPGSEKVDIAVEIQAGKSLPVLGPLVSVDGSMSLQPSPFRIDLGGTIKILVFEMAKADATIVTQGFKARIQTNQFFGFIPYTTDVSITAFTRSGGQFTFAGSGRVAIEMKKGAFGQKCTDPFLFIPAFCIDLPPFDLPTLAAARVEAGEFTNGLFGFKGLVNVLGLGDAGFFVDERGSLTFRNVDRFQLITAPFVAAARAAWQKAVAAGEVVNASAAWNGYTFLQDAEGKSIGVIVDVPLIKPKADPSQVQAAGASDVISQVNLIQTEDVLFNLIATQPLSFTLITPNGQEVTPANYGAIGDYAIEYTQYKVWGEKQQTKVNHNGDFIQPVTDTERIPTGRLLFTAVSYDPQITALDLRIDGVTIYYDLDPLDTAWLTSLALAPGNHSVELRKHGTSTVVLNGSFKIITDTFTSLISFGGAQKGLAVLKDDNTAPATMGKAKVRFINAASPTLNMVVDGTPLFSALPYLNSSEYGLVDAGSHVIEFRNNNNNALVAQALTPNLADGGVYTFFATDDVTDAEPSYDVRVMVRTDARYSPIYYTTFSIDQAAMNESWKVKVSGDTDNVPYKVTVEGQPSPPILGSVMVDANNPAAAQVSWQLTSDYNPTTIQIYANPNAISDSFTVSNTDGSPNMEEIPLYEGQLLAEYPISDLAQLGGQLVTKIVDLSKLESGTYHIWVRADDGVNPPASSYAASTLALAASATPSRYGLNATWLAKDDYNIAHEFNDAAPIAIDHASSFPAQWTATLTPTFDAASNGLNVEWQVNSHPDVDSYRLWFGNTPLNPTQVITVGQALAVLDANGNPTHVKVGFVRIEDIRPDVNYFISIEAIDSESGRSVRSQEVPFSVASTPFAITGPQSPVNVTAGGKATVPVTLNANGELFFPNVWLSTNLGGTPPGITARFANDTEGFPGLNTGAPTRTLEIQVDKEVPNGTYPVVISGYNGDKKEALTIELVVSGSSNNPTQNVYLPLVTR